MEWDDTCAEAANPALGVQHLCWVYWHYVRHYAALQTAGSGARKGAMNPALMTREQ